MPIGGDLKASPLVGEVGGNPMKRPNLRKYAKRAGLIVLALVALDLAASAAAMVFGMEYLKR